MEGRFPIQLVDVHVCERESLKIYLIKNFGDFTPGSPSEKNVIPITVRLPVFFAPV